MPYNNTPIVPSDKATGTVNLPRMLHALSSVLHTSHFKDSKLILDISVARVKKIIAADDDIGNCSNNAAFVITVATELFLHHLVEQSYNIVKSERKPRRNIQYRDVGK